MIVALKNNLKTKMQLATQKKCDYVLMNCLFSPTLSSEPALCFSVGGCNDLVPLEASLRGAAGSRSLS